MSFFLQAARVKQAMSKKKALEKMDLVEDPRLEVGAALSLFLTCSAAPAYPSCRVH